MPKIFPAKEATKDKFKNGDMCHYEILRSEVASKEFGRIAQFMNQMKSYRSVPRQQVLFSFAGYDDDKRELIIIPEVVQYTKEILNQHSYFWYYAIPQTSDFFLTAFTFDENDYSVIANEVTRKLSVRVDPERFGFLAIEIKDALQSIGTHIDDEDGAFDCYKAWVEAIMSFSSPN